MSKVYRVITDRILQLLEQGTVPWRQPWSSVAGLPRNLKSGNVYRGVNLFVLAFSGYGSPYWLTYRQARERGGRVRKGERGWPVIFWKDLRSERADQQADEEEDNRPRFVARYYTVFNATQTEGVEFPQPTVQNPDFDPIIRCEQLTAQMPNPPAIEHQELRAWYNPRRDAVNVPAGEYFVHEAEYYSTLFHELIHATGHESRLSRSTLQPGQGFGTDPYCREELIAEMGAAMLCGHAGIDDTTIENSAAYLSHWIERLNEDPKIVVTAAGQAQKAADYILGTFSRESSAAGTTPQAPSYYPSREPTIALEEANNENA